MSVSSSSKTVLWRFSFIYGGGRKELVIVLVLDVLYFVDLQGPISAEFFNS